MAPSQAAALLVVPSLLSNVFQLRPWSGLPILWRRLRGLLLGSCLGTAAGAFVWGLPAGPAAQGALGAVLLAYAAWGLAGARLALQARFESRLGPVAGFITGVITNATGVFMVPAVPYLQALGLQRDALVQAMGLSFTVSTVALAVSLAAQGAYTGTDATASLVMVLPTLAGMALGQRLRGCLSPALFRTVFLVCVAALGAHMVAHALQLY